jgi:DnaJ domain
MNHHFSLDPRTVLGVSRDASHEEIDRAFREKTKKHHPDLGGDEWAFRMVLRAHELLKATSDLAQQPLSSTTATWKPCETASASPPDGPLQDAPLTPSRSDFHTVDVELVWIRLELAGNAEPSSDEKPTATTLSVCLVVSWPRLSFVKHSAAFPDAADSLRHLIATFEQLHAREPANGSRSRIEDGQFVGWLSYPNVLEAEAGFQVLRDALAVHNLKVSLQTRDEPIPTEWLNR